jgi:hypothetical protein
MAVIEMLLYSPNAGTNSLTLVWGRNRVIPVQMTGLQITEQMFDPSLNPIRVEIAVTLHVRTEANFVVARSHIKSRANEASRHELRSNREQTRLRATNSYQVASK